MSAIFRLEKSFRFEASHQLKFHDGKCRRLHGHSWTLTIQIEGEKLQPDRLEVNEPIPTMTSNPKKHMLMDYSDISAIVKPYVDQKLDHWHLNETYQTDSPTSEFLAKAIFHDLRPHLPGLISIQIDETCTSSCRYEER